MQSPAAGPGSRRPREAGAHDVVAANLGRGEKPPERLIYIKRPAAARTKLGLVPSTSEVVVATQALSVFKRAIEISVLVGAALVMSAAAVDAAHGAPVPSAAAIQR